MNEGLCIISDPSLYDELQNIFCNVLKAIFVRVHTCSLYVTQYNMFHVQSCWRSWYLGGAFSFNYRHKKFVTFYVWIYTLYIHELICDVYIIDTILQYRCNTMPLRYLSDREIVEEIGTLSLLTCLDILL